LDKGFVVMTTEPVAFDAVRGLALLALVPLSIAVLLLAFRLVRVYINDRSEYVRNKERSPSMKAVIRGELPNFHDAVRDERVAAGVAVDVRNNVWVEQGKLSEEAVSSVLR
jgi:hypothetical protein